MPNFRPLAIALGISLATLVPTHDAFAAKKKAARAPAVSAQCSDFYDATNAGWLKANPVPQTGATTALGQLVERSRQQQRELLDAAMKSPQGNVQKLLGDFWASGLDEAAVEADGSNPIAPLLTRINAIKKAKDVPASIAALHQVGIPVAFNFGPDVDLKALDRHIGYFMQGGMGLPDPAFYTRTDADTVALMGRYRNYVKQILALTGTPAARLDAESQSVIALETELARNAQSLAGINNPFNNYAPISTKELNSRYRNLQLDAFLKAQGVDDDLVSLADPGLFKQLDGMVTKLKPDQWKAYLRWRVGDSMAPYLSKAYRDAEFEFRGRVLRGETLPPQRWEDVLEAINVAAGPMVGREYAARYLSAEDRRQAAWIVDKLREVQIEAVKNKLDERRSQDRSAGQAGCAEDRDRHPVARPRLQRAADGPRFVRRQHADRVDLAPPRGNEAHRQGQRRPPLGRAAAAAVAGLRPGTEPPDRYRGDPAGPGVQCQGRRRRQVRQLRWPGRP